MCLKRVYKYLKEYRLYKRKKERRDYLSNKYNEELKRKPSPNDGVIQTRNINMERQRRLKEYQNEMDELNKFVLPFEWGKKEIKKKFGKIIKNYIWPLLLVIIGVLLTIYFGRKC